MFYIIIAIELRSKHCCSRLTLTSQCAVKIDSLAVAVVDICYSAAKDCHNRRTEGK